MDQSENAMRKLMEQIARTQQQELDCGEVFAVLDQYAEAMLAGASIAGENGEEQFAMVTQHLDLCRDCLEEYEALLSVLEVKH